MGEILSSSSYEPDQGGEGLPLPTPGWQPCDGCQFAGEVTDFSMDGTARVSDDLASEGEPYVTFIQNEGTDNERQSGGVYVGLGGGSYGTGDGYEAVSYVLSRIRECSKRDGKLEGPRLRVLGIGLGTLKACGAFYRQDTPNDVPYVAEPFIKVENAK